MRSALLWPLSGTNLLSIDAWLFPPDHECGRPWHLHTSQTWSAVHLPFTFQPLPHHTSSPLLHYWANFVHGPWVGCQNCSTYCTWPEFLTWKVGHPSYSRAGNCLNFRNTKLIKWRNVCKHCFDATVASYNLQPTHTNPQTTESTTHTKTKHVSSQAQSSKNNINLFHTRQWSENVSWNGAIKVRGKRETVSYRDRQTDKNRYRRQHISTQTDTHADRWQNTYL